MLMTLVFLFRCKSLKYIICDKNIRMKRIIREISLVFTMTILFSQICINNLDISNEIVVIVLFCAETVFI